MADAPFWETKSLAEMTKAEFESVCDGCARCCLVKLEDADTRVTHYTDVACRLLDTGTCRCTDYGHRTRRVPDCMKLTPGRAKSYSWLPKTCGYRLLAAGRPLYWWHPLVSGDRASVHAAGISVRGRTVGSERDFSDDETALRIVLWPNQFRMPRRRAKKKPARKRK